MHRYPCQPCALGALALLVVVVTMWIAGCATTPSAGEVAYRTLFEPNGAINVPAFKAALEARFTPGTTAANLVAYIRAQPRGTVYLDSGGRAEKVMFEPVPCVVDIVAELKVSGEEIERITFSSGQVICD